MKHCRTMLLAAVAAVLLISAAGPAAGAPAPPAAAAPSPAAPQLTSMAVSQPAAAPQPPAAAAHFDAEAATAAYLATLSPEARAKSDAYFEGGYWLILWDFLTGLLVAWLLLGTGLSARVRDKVESTTRLKWLQTALYAVFSILFTSLVLLPWNAYEGYFREHQYGMSNQTMGAWLGDQLKGLVLGLILGTLALVAIYAVLRKAPRTWWLWGSLVAIAFAMFGAAIAPVYLEPVFNKFKPLPDSALKQQILSMARANGIPATDVYEFDASKQTKRMSAHVSGLLGTTQISMNDNLMKRGSAEEIQAVLGHEMGHYVLHHVYKGMVFIGIIIVVGFAFMSWSFGKVQARYGARWGIRDVGDVAALPLLLFLFSVYALVLTPVNNTLTRTMEAEADNYGVNVSRQPDGFAQAALHLSEYRKMKPGPIEEFVFYDHPSGWNRIHRVMVWKAEHLDDCDIAAYDAAHPAAPSVVVRKARQ
ncbi:MAG TPA: M48 family metallopeptidase [Thermoanaerobaculia bacterium]|nr:M48 family metallopeptidase [Thermoanaerobaculia bacterium]